MQSNPKFIPDLKITIAAAITVIQREECYRVMANFAKSACGAGGANLDHFLEQL